MKLKPSFAIALMLLVATGAATLFAQQDQKKKAVTWEERKAEKLKPVSDEQKASIDEAVAKLEAQKPEKDRKILVFWRCEGFIHTSIPCGNYALEQIGGKTGAFSAELAEEYDVFTADNLAKYDAVLFNNTTHLKFETDEQKKALLDFLASGKGLIGLHAASDSFYDWAEGAEKIGGQFDGHPWNANGRWSFRLNDAKHRLNQAFDGKGFWHTDEIYWYKPDTYVGPEKIRILVSLDNSTDANKKAVENPKFAEQLKDGIRDVPVSWLRKYEDGGRLFYSNFGHREDTFWNPMILQHFLDGIQYALGDLEADATPTAKAEGLEEALAPKEQE